MNRPFLKWAGNKFQIIERILRHLPHNNRLIEPFVGSGAVFLNTNYESYLLADANKDLIALYGILKNEIDAFVNLCQQFYSSATNTKDFFYQSRTIFNTTENKKLKAALFIYLNRHGYNGLCRYNSSGKFNVPFGCYKKSVNLPVERMRVFHEKAQYAQFVSQDFLTTLSQAKQGDVVYCDPPYVPLSETANFTNYHGLNFRQADHIALAETAKKLSRQGISVIISNHDLPFTRDIYHGAHFESFELRRLISSDGKNRKLVRELISVF